MLSAAVQEFLRAVVKAQHVGEKPSGWPLGVQGCEGGGGLVCLLDRVMCGVGRGQPARQSGEVVARLAAAGFPVSDSRAD